MPSSENSLSKQMHSQQYLHNDFNLYPSPHLHPHVAPSLALQSLGHYNYDAQTYDPDAFGAHFDMSKPLNQIQYIPVQPQQQQQQQLHQQQQYQSQPTNQFNPSSYVTQNMYHTVDTSKRHRPSTSISSDETLPTPTMGRPPSLRAPKFDRTYTDALEDELYDESAPPASRSVASQNTMSRQPAHGFAYPRTNQQYANQAYMSKNTPASSLAHLARNASQQQPLRAHAENQAGNMVYPQNTVFDPLGNRQDSQRLSSTAVADSVRRLQVPNRTTVSPREAFLDYPDSADFRERTLFSSSSSPYSHTHEIPDITHSHESESSFSNDDDYNESEDTPLPLPSMPYQMMPVNNNSLALPQESRSTSTSTHNTGVFSGDLTAESVSSSDSEYNPNPSSRRVSRSSGRGSTLIKSFACPECGKRFEKSHPLQAHRRNSHGKGNGPPSLSQQKFSNTAHRCEWMDPNTGKMCNTVFSRPYDLIRHYETKHSAKRQEFICPHCEDRKSFSRGDALRRHLRVKHPSTGRK